MQKNHDYSDWTVRIAKNPGNRKRKKKLSKHRIVSFVFSLICWDSGETFVWRTSACRTVARENRENSEKIDNSRIASARTIRLREITVRRTERYDLPPVLKFYFLNNQNAVDFISVLIWLLHEFLCSLKNVRLEFF